MDAVERCSVGGGEAAGDEGERRGTDRDVWFEVETALVAGARLREALVPVFFSTVVAEVPPFFKARSRALRRLRSS